MIFLSIDSKFNELDEIINRGLFSEANSIIGKFSLDTNSENDKFQLNIYKGIVLVEMGDFEKAKSSLYQPFTQTFIDNYKNLFFKSLIYKAIIMFRTSKVEEGISFLNSILPDVIRYKNDSLESLAYNWLGNGHWLNGNLEEALNYHELALDIRRIQGNNEEVATSFNNIGIIYRVQGKLKKAIDIFNRGIDYNSQSTKINFYLYTNRGQSYNELGNLNKGMSDHLKSYELATESGSNYLLSDALFNIIRTTYSLKELDTLLEYSGKFDVILEFPSIKTLKLMAYAYIKMLTDPKSSLDDWVEALNDESLEFGYKLICYEEMLSIYSTERLYNHDKVLDLLDKFEKMVKENNLYTSLPKIYFVRALIFKNVFEIDKAEDYFNEAIEISINHGLPLHENLARAELKNMREKMQKFDSIYQQEEINPEPQVEYENIMSYIQNFKSILSEKFEN